jgi:glycine oxidase
MRKSDELRAADVGIVGGGVAGLAVARELARRGLRVVVVEGGEPGGGASSAAAGMLAPQAEADERDAFFELLCASRELYPSFAEALREESGIDIELERTGTLYLALSDLDAEEVEKRFAWQTGAGLVVERLTAEEARSLEPSVSTRVRVALRFPRDWQVENRRLVSALAASAENFGARVWTHTRVDGVRIAGGRAAGIETSRGFLAAGAVVLAAGARTSHVRLLVAGPDALGADTDIAGHPPIEPVRGQMLCFRQPKTSAPFVRHVVYSPRGYLVPRRDGRLLAGSTTEHAGFDASVTAEGVRDITAHAVEIAPAVEGFALADAWAGLRPRAEDERPLLGESADVKNLFYATGHYRNGILLAPATGELIADLVVQGSTSLLPRTLASFSPARFRRALAGSYRN